MRRCARNHPVRVWRMATRHHASERRRRLGLERPDDVEVFNKQPADLVGGDVIARFSRGEVRKAHAKRMRARRDRNAGRELTAMVVAFAAALHAPAEDRLTIDGKHHGYGVRLIEAPVHHAEAELVGGRGGKHELAVEGATHGKRQVGVRGVLIVAIGGALAEVVR